MAKGQTIMLETKHFAIKKPKTDLPKIPSKQWHVHVKFIERTVIFFYFSRQ